MEKTAHLSKCRKYRYTLHRTWDNSKEKIVFIGVNPSTADETIDDATLTKCMNYAKAWGYGGLVMLNLFAYRATDPTVMKSARDPIGGSENDSFIKKYTDPKKISKVICAWGEHGKHLDRANLVIKSHIHSDAKLYALKINKSGAPHHPLYLSNKVKPTIYKVR